MGWLSKLFGATSKSSAGVAEQAVIVQFDYGSNDLQAIFAVGDELDAAIVAAKAGEFDGNEIAGDGRDGSLFMYGPDADRLFEIAKPILERWAFLRGAKVKLRYGPPQDGVRERQIVLGH